MKLILSLIALMALLALPYGAGYMECHDKAEVMGFSFKYGFYTGCMIEHQPGKWIPIENLRATE